MHNHVVGVASVCCLHPDGQWFTVRGGSGGETPPAGSFVVVDLAKCADPIR